MYRSLSTAHIPLHFDNVMGYNSLTTQFLIQIARRFSDMSLANLPSSHHWQQRCWEGQYHPGSVQKEISTIQEQCRSNSTRRWFQIPESYRVGCSGKIIFITPTRQLFTLNFHAHYRGDLTKTWIQMPSKGVLFEPYCFKYFHYLETDN